MENYAEYVGFYRVEVVGQESEVNEGNKQDEFNEVQLRMRWIRSFTFNYQNVMLFSLEKVFQICRYVFILTDIKKLYKKYNSNF